MGDTDPDIPKAFKTFCLILSRYSDGYTVSQEFQYNSLEEMEMFHWEGGQGSWERGILVLFEEKEPSGENVNFKTSSTF